MQAKLDSLNMLHDVEQRVKNFDPVAYARLATLYIGRGLSSSNNFARWRPDYLIHSIDACFAHARQHTTKMPTESDVTRVLDIYKSFSDPLLLHYLTDQRALAPAMSLLGRQQFLFQHRPHYRDFGRAAFMFLEQRMPRSDELLRERYGIATSDWLFCSLEHMQLRSTNNPQY